ncbi:MAG: serine/threonine-protein phosphatase [Planctomyces sp.]|nr:serine/threonine-protein phosphatase [Planctomyces sp.]
MAGPANNLILTEQDLATPQLMSFAGGQVAVFSRRCPHRNTVNEDAAAVLETSGKTGALVIADGVGGMQAGHHASALAVNALFQRLTGNTGHNSHLRSAILDGFEDANDQICELGVQAATTLAVIEVQQDRVRPYHVGDSMILLCGQRGRLHWQSISHSPVGYAIESGMMDEIDAMSHPDRHYVSNLVGCPEMRIEIGPRMEMSPRDTLLICSDGLSDNLSTDEIISVVRCGHLGNAVQKLVDIATQRMTSLGQQLSHPSKPDDLTIIAFRRVPLSSARKSHRKHSPRSAQGNELIATPEGRQAG